MQLLRLLALVAVGVLAVVGYVQEGRRLEMMRRLPAEKARDYYESVRTRNDRMMWAVAAVFLAGAIFAVVRVWMLAAASAPGA